MTADELPAALEAGALLLTSTSRLAADWRRRLVASDAADIVDTPAVEAWASWLAALVRSRADMPVPYTQLQELQLWERIIVADMGKGIAASGLARHAAQIYGLIREYGIDVGELADGGEEAEALQRWIAAMQDDLGREGRMLSADMPALLLPHIGAMAGIERILLDGFDDPSPMQQRLLQALAAHGIPLTAVAVDGEPTTPTLTACPDVESECRLVAARVRRALADDAGVRIGIVTVGQEPAMLGRLLDEALLPSGEGVMRAVAMGGKPLAARPLIRQLLDCLSLAGEGGAHHARLAALLFSPGVRGHGEEGMARAQLDARLRKGNRHYLSFRALQGMAAKGGMPQLAAVVDHLAAWDTVPRTAGEWVGAAHTLLQAIGFLQADVVGRSDAEIRELNAFRECLASLVAVEAVRGRMPWGVFVSLLSQVCRQMSHALPAHLTQVCVLPIEQVTGLRFDMVFAVGCDDEALPMAARPLPLLPLAVQRRHGLPGTTPRLAFAASDFLWKQLCRAAPVVHASYAMNRDERELAASSLLAGIVSDIRQEALRVPEPFGIEAWDDAPMVPLTAAEQVLGGSAIIKNQSACPFRAFATHRLGIQPLGETEPGILPTEKGSLMHHALQFIWERLRSQQALLALDGGALTALVDDAVEHAWQEARVTVAESTQGFERRRMAFLLAAWLDEEKGRPAFTVECCERNYRLELPAAGVLRFPVALKADRIDRDGDGHRILIDYKTGVKQRVGEWVGTRMAQPQLPLYAVAEGLGDADAVCFARVRSGDMGYEGLSGAPTGIRGIAVYQGKDEEAQDWSELLARWQERIDALASEFVAGRCEVAPRDAHACEYCGLEAVCRIDEIGIDRDADEGDEA